MKLKIFLFTALCFTSQICSANLVWTDNGNPWGAGKTITLVYPQFDQKRIVFRTSDSSNIFYSYNWGDSIQMTENAKSVMSLLLTALATKKKVSFFYDDAITAYSPVTAINIHD
jgi:hypothetical protein